MNAHPFDRAGIAALSDLERTEWKEIYSALAAEQDAFLAKEKYFRSANYRWPKNALNNWSRIWEYPFVYHNLKRWQIEEGLSRPRVIDVGSGVTFFPFALAKLGFDVVCTDIDPICHDDLGRAAQYVDHEPGRVDFRLATESALPFGDAEVDAAYCISVIEHVPDIEGFVRELARILKPGAPLILTIDLDLRGDHELGPAARTRLMDELEEYFLFALPNRTVHPADILDSSTGPFKLTRLKGIDLLKLVLRQVIVRAPSERRLLPLISWHLTVEGLYLKLRGE